VSVTLRDVAAKSGVSSVTVSRALNNSGYVSEKVRQRIAVAVAELNYVPNSVASSLRSKRTRLLALLLPDITNPFWTTVARSVEDAATEQGYAVILCNTDEDPSKEGRYIELLLRRRIDGLIVGPTNESFESLKRLMQHGVHFVLVDRRVEGLSVDCVKSDSYDGAHQVTRHLLETGHKRIAIITGPMTVPTSKDRVAGYVAAHQACGSAINDKLIFVGSYCQSWGFKAASDLLSGNPCPDAIFAANSLIALGVLEAARTLNLRIPDDIALVSFDELPQITVANRFLTSVIQPSEDMGRLTIRLLLDRLANPDRAIQEITLPVKLLIGTSCGCS